MADSDKTPRPKVELDGSAKAASGKGDARSGQGATGEKGSAAGASSDAAASDAAAGFAKVSAWVSRTFPGHENAFWGGVCGLLVALVLLTLGILKTVVLVLLVIAGIAVGQLVDGDPKLIRALQRLFSNNQ